ncbi:MAG: hypothetical protein Q8L90_15875 [Bacteroidota bacterium]|nr:hypothetical protein [Bacteroidota bacterium]
MTEKDFQPTNENIVKPLLANQKLILVGIQKKIQNLHSDSANSGFLQQLLNEAGQLIKLSDKDAGTKIREYAEELDFYLNGGSDDLTKFYHCKAETLTIIAKQVGA